MSRGLLERVTGHLRGGIVGPLDECAATANRCHSSCSGCIDVHCDKVNETIAKCHNKIEQFLVDKLGYCYGLMARFGVTFPTIDEIIGKSRPVPIRAGKVGPAQGVFEGPEAGGGGGGQPMAEPINAVLEVAPGAVVPEPDAEELPMPKFVGDMPEELPPPKEDRAIPKDEVARILGIGAPVAGRVRGPNDANPALEVGQPQGMPPFLLLVQILCQCGGQSLSQAFASVNNMIRFGAPIPPLPADKAKEKLHLLNTPETGWLAPALPEEGVPYSGENFSAG